MKCSLVVTSHLLRILLSFSPCLPKLGGSRGEELPERLSMELGCVHCDRRDWGWGGSFIDRLPTSMQFTFKFGFSPAEKIYTTVKCYYISPWGLVKHDVFSIQRVRSMPLTESVGAVGVGGWLRLFGLQVRKAWGLGVTWKWIQGGFGPTRMQAWVGRGWLLLLLLH